MKIGGNDFRAGVRLLFKNPSFTIAAVLAMSLGIATSTMIFSILNAVLLRPLPYSNPHEVMIVWTRFEARNARDLWLSPPEVKDLRQQGTLFKDFAAMTDLTLNLTGGGDPEQVQAVAGSSNIFSLLGVNMIQGRGFLPEDDRTGAAKVVVLSHNFWQRRFGGNENVLNQSLTLDGEPFEVVGVLPASFSIPPPSSVFPERVDIYVPFDSTVPTAGTSNRDLRHVHVLARAQPGVTLQQAESQVSGIAVDWQQRYPEAYPADSGFRLSIVPFHEYVVKSIKPSILILFSASILVLVIACVNIANLLLARAAAREKEFGIRVCLGAGPGRVIRLLLIESSLLALAGGVLGALMAVAGLRILLQLSPSEIPLLQTSRIDLATLAFTALIVLLSAFVFGLTPAWHATKINISELLTGSSKSASMGIRNRRFSSGLVVVQLGILLVLLIAVGLLIQSFLQLQKQQLGFVASNVLTMQLKLNPAYYPQPADRAEFLRRIEKELETLPGVQAVGGVTQLPLSGAVLSSGFSPMDDSPWRDQPPFSADLRAITPGYFKTLKIPLIEGRGFADSDLADSPPKVVLDESLAKRFWPNQSAIGKRIKWIRSETPLEVVGIVGAVKHVGLDQPSRETAYLPITQYARTQSVFFAVRTAAEPGSFAQAVRNQIWKLDRNQPVADVQPMDVIVWKSIARQRLNLFLLSIFVVVAVVLATVGMYGMMSYAVTQRNREIGIRMALGATRPTILRMVLWRALSLAVIGVAIGLCLAIGLTRFMESILFGVNASDPLVFVLPSLFLIGVILIASYIPARRATKVDPLISLRSE